MSALRRGMATAVLVLLVAAAAWSAAGALRTSERTARAAWGRRNESYAAAQARLFGEEYFASVREVRARVPADGVVHFIDAEDSPSGVTYTTLYYLAPRRLELVGVRREASARRLRRELPPGVERVLIVGEHRRPLRYVAAEELVNAIGDAR